MRVASRKRISMLAPVTREGTGFQPGTQARDEPRRAKRPLRPPGIAPVAKLAHAPALGAGPYQDCGFESRRGHLRYRLKRLPSKRHAVTTSYGQVFPISGLYESRLPSTLPIRRRIRWESVSRQWE